MTYGQARLQRLARPASGQKADPRPGHYYALAMDIGRMTGRVAYLAGPFATHQEALDLVGRATAAAQEVNPWAAFLAFGTGRLPLETQDPPQGKLNALLGVTPTTPKEAPANG